MIVLTFLMRNTQLSNHFPSNFDVYSALSKSFTQKRTFLTVVTMMNKKSLLILWNEFEAQISATTQYAQ